MNPLKTENNRRNLQESDNISYFSDSDQGLISPDFNTFDDKPFVNQMKHHRVFIKHDDVLNNYDDNLKFLEFKSNHLTKPPDEIVRKKNFYGMKNLLTIFENLKSSNLESSNEIIK